MASEGAESDPEFAEQLAYDSVGALRSAGWEALAAEVEREQQHVAELASRLDGDDEFFNRVASDPDSLADDGIPTEAIALVLLALGAPDELVEKASAEVEAHASIKPTLAVVTVTLGAFGFAGQAVASPTIGRSAARRLLARYAYRSPVAAWSKQSSTNISAIIAPQRYTAGD